ncbi:glycosyltransferase [Candidatus Thiosymbion oneisti]|uniref:glycosyltransferase n=1 Tax=Candidatus Thiosymbion oneisti TaxID=589554 RepID=UPI000B7DFC9D|nr:glycosyltransferase [Candidatus Thiosymbion oneisti]
MGKIAILLPGLKFGGTERVALNLARALKAEGFKIDFILMSYEGEFLAEVESSFDVYNLRCNRTWKLPMRLLDYIVKQKPNALISSFWKLNVCACLTRLVYPAYNLILWEHSQPSKSDNSPTWLYSISASLIYQLATKVVVVSSDVFKDVQRITLGLGRKLMIIFNPISPPAFKLCISQREAGSRNIIWVGRLDEPKNPGLMLDTFVTLIKKDKNYRLDFVGDGKLRSELVQHSLSLGLQDNVRFLGFQPDPYVLMARANLLVLTSNREGFGNVLVEALYCGLHVVSTDCGEGIRDILQNNRYGSIVPTKDKNALATAIEREFDTEHDWRAQIEGAQRFLPRKIALQFIEALDLGRTSMIYPRGDSQV